MSVTVVVPTHNRYQKLRNLLASIKENWSEEIASVIVVDDSDIKSTFDGFEGIRLLHIKLGSRVFISKAKNMGWKTSRSEYVYFIDDDNVINERTLPATIEAIKGADVIGAIMPAVFYKSRPGLVWVYATPFLNRRLGLNLVGRNLPRDPSLENRLLRTDALPNASLVRRKALEDVNGFDERLVVNSSLDLTQRLKAKGWRVLAYTGAQTFHDVEAPGRVGWWAAHGSVDPERVRFELRDWFFIMKGLHRGEGLLNIRLVIQSLRFVLPNLLAYLIRGKFRKRSLNSVLVGYLEGIRNSQGPGLGRHRLSEEAVTPLD
ncbi:MAG: glycosyltransferase [Thaumarchaeota archaeon]|nr:glycosyltransferase [Nitrososphaerota archaeon]